jgi:amino acid transporter/mannitol/fructose-specific phosphotransferase system IIA component (Ntr-type)
MMGTLGGLTAWLSLAFKSAFALLGIGLFLVLFNPGFTEDQIKLIAMGCCLIFAVINIVGVKLAGKIQTYMVISLITLLVLYVIVGSFSVEFSRYTPFAPKGIGSIFATAGLVFVSFAGTTKIAAVAGEVKNPGRNLPLGMFLSWGIVSVLYISVIFVTVGVVDSGVLENPQNLPISLGGEATMGLFGLLIMSIAAFLAFVSTGNAGILAASRDPMAMGEDELLPGVFQKVSRRGTPWFSILFTAGFMMAIIWFLKLEDFVKTASTLKLLLFILANLALIFMRESNRKHYKPKFKAPLYPWVQIIGILGMGFLISRMGNIPLMITGIFIVCALTWYFIYSHGKIKREYALLHVLERVIGAKRDHVLDEELREILIERDNVTKTRFEEKIKNCEILDLDYFVAPADFAKNVSERLAKRLKMSEKKLYGLLLKREKDSNIIVRPGGALISFHIKGRNKFEIVIVRTKKGAVFSEESPPVHAAFIVVSSHDEKSFYLHSLMWIVQILEKIDFEKNWIKAKNKNELCCIVQSTLKNECREF